MTEWLDQMVTKLKDELERQLIAVSRSRDTDAKSLAANARSLSALERTLDRLTRLERERAQVRERKIAKHDQSKRAALECRLDKLAAAAKPKKPAGGTE